MYIFVIFLTQKSSKWSQIWWIFFRETIRGILVAEGVDQVSPFFDKNLTFWSKNDVISLIFPKNKLLSRPQKTVCFEWNYSVKLHMSKQNEKYCFWWFFVFYNKSSKSSTFLKKLTNFWKHKTCKKREWLGQLLCPASG